MSDDNKTVSFNIQQLFVPIAILLAGGAIAAGLYFGLNKSNDTLGTTDTSKTDTTKTDTTGNTATTGTASINNGAVLGDKSKAKVAIIEFSDFQCSYCKKFHDETLEQIKKNFIDTGKAILVFKNFPLPMHPRAQKDAEAAECAKDQGGDTAFYKYHEALFTKTDLSDDNALISLAESQGLNKSTFEQCLTSDKMATKTASDMSEGQKAGISGTPGFIVGKINSDGSVTGTLIKGAYPYSTFETTINNYLK